VTRALFICGKARMRSPTAADIADQYQFNEPALVDLLIRCFGTHLGALL